MVNNNHLSSTESVAHAICFQYVYPCDHLFAQNNNMIFSVIKEITSF